jgi:hypothetical protein
MLLRPNPSADEPVNGLASAEPNGVKMASNVSPIRGRTVGTSTATMSSNTRSRLSRTRSTTTPFSIVSTTGGRNRFSTVKVGSIFTSGAHSTKHRSCACTGTEV